jgi:predicted secreted protein
MDLTREDSGAHVTARVGELITVALDEVATSGYRWEPDVDESILRPLPRAEEPTTAPRGGSRRVPFTFEPRRPGDARLRLVNRRPWGDTPPADEFVAEVHIHAE